MKPEQLKLPLDGQQSFSKEREMVEEMRVDPVDSHLKGPGAATLKVEKAVYPPTPTVDCRCNLYKRGKEWCRWFESGDCREA